MSDATVLIVDDEEDVRGLVREILTRAGYGVLEAADGQEGLRAFYADRPDLVVLDVSMPVLDGWDTLARIRELSEVPVIMLTARGEELQRVRGLAAGADDYVTKPFGRQELVARVQALLRRAGRAAAEEEPDRYSDGLLSVDVPQRLVTYAGRAVDLTPLEFGLLLALVRHPRQVLSREQLLELVWRDPFAVSTEQVKLYVSYLRRKLDAESPDSVPIETVRGFGYRYRPPAG